MPGGVSQVKAPAIENIARVMAPGGVLFGNLEDTEAGLRDILGRSFHDVELKTFGGIAVFVATNQG
jgi:hypothetical protein